MPVASFNYMGLLYKSQFGVRKTDDLSLELQTKDSHTHTHIQTQQSIHVILNSRKCVAICRNGMESIKWRFCIKWHRIGFHKIIIMCAYPFFGESEWERKKNIDTYYSR